ncbi:XRE family transcriptional regulator [Hominisplanchenecus murintestinalis]|uniref:XRE family transcriptional regulator n=1 Tax=Hominisplanchenecus murintestinalis TaxID=2941517 RepID=A0AC61QZW7_9FIRM|nr:helix-turn-helix transcriptional regulator [Hominisplanchenecus murintestinalis]TGX98799.1 XRE family transcriptional regulator [Hominisplanchenecus murintestinalis]
MHEFEYHYSSSDIGNRLKVLRKSKKMTQEELAELLGVSTDSISNYENGKTTIMPEHLMEVCQIFNVSADYLLFNKKKLLFYNDIDYQVILDKIEQCNEFDLSRINKMIDILLNKSVA